MDIGADTARGIGAELGPADVLLTQDEEDEVLEAGGVAKVAFDRSSVVLEVRVPGEDLVLESRHQSEQK